MSVKNHIRILSELDSDKLLNSTEKQLFEVNLKLATFNYYCVKKIAVEGINSLINQVNFRLAIRKLVTNKEILFSDGFIKIKRW